MRTLRVDVWSDIACPWCYVGKRRLEGALARMPERNTVQVVWRAFELNPSAPRVIENESSYAERLARKYGTSVAQADAMIRRMTDIAAACGLDFRFDRIRPGNTFDAHRLLHLAADHSKQGELKERLLRAYLTEGAAIGDPQILLRLARDVGLDADTVQAVLGTDAYAKEVRADERAAHDLGIQGVPFFVVSNRYAVSGAQSEDVLLQVLDRAWNEAAAGDEFSDRDACGPEGCAEPAT